MNNTNKENKVTIKPNPSVVSITGQEGPTVEDLGKAKQEVEQEQTAVKVDVDFDQQSKHFYINGISMGCLVKRAVKDENGNPYYDEMSGFFYQEWGFLDRAGNWERLGTDYHKAIRYTKDMLAQQALDNLEAAKIEGQTAETAVEDEPAPILAYSLNWGNHNGYEGFVYVSFDEFARAMKDHFVNTDAAIKAILENNGRLALTHCIAQVEVVNSPLLGIIDRDDIPTFGNLKKAISKARQDTIKHFGGAPGSFYNGKLAGLEAVQKLNLKDNTAVSHVIVHYIRVFIDEAFALRENAKALAAAGYIDMRIVRGLNGRINGLQLAADLAKELRDLDMMLTVK